MGIVNATPDSFSDLRRPTSLEERVDHARRLLADGADIIDVGGESGITGVPPVAAEEEAARVVPLVQRIAGELGALVSVDTYKPAVAGAAIAAGACLVNDTSGLRDPALAELCAETGAGLVVMHTRASPKDKRFARELDGRVAADVAAFLAERTALARARGVRSEQLVLDPGPDFGKTPAQTVEALRGLGTVRALGRPVLLAISRKDFIGAITGRPPRARSAGTLAALSWGVEAGGEIFRVHDVAAAADFLAVRAVLRGEERLDPTLRLDDELRREPPAGT